MSSHLRHKVKTYLASNHMFVDEDWLSGCIEYLTEDNNSAYSELEIQCLAKEQWLLNDLKDICPGSLPSNLKGQLKVQLNGPFVLQINAAIDIGTPAYQQYLKLKKVNMENIEATIKFEDKISSHRMIKLYMTDGVQEVCGIEYRPMRNLSCDITPGCKVLVKGPVECRRGIILLTENAIELLGGEVQEIAETNSLAGLLSSKLGVPLVQEDTDNNTVLEQQIPKSNEPTIVPIIPTLDQNRTRTVARVTSVQAANFADDDIDMDQLTAIEQEFTNTKSTNDSIETTTIPSENIDVSDASNKTADFANRQMTNEFSNPKKSKTNELPEPSKRSIVDYFSNPNKRSVNDDLSNPSKRSMSDDLSNPSKRQMIDPRNQNQYESEKQLNTNTVDDYPTDLDMFLEDEDYVKEMEAQFDAKENEMNKSLTISSEPFVYIQQINEMTEDEKVGRVFKIKGQIIRLLSKMSVGKDGWSLRCTLIDGSGSLDVDFSSDVLSKVVGFTPQEMNQIKKLIGTNPEMKAKTVSALQKARDTLQVLYCIIEITMLENPVITQLISFEDHHVDLLKNRQNYL